MAVMQGNVIIREYQSKCVRCGQCRSVCPVLDILGKEPASPRGKVYLAGLIARGEVPPGPRAEEILSLCLVCGACSAQCPSGLPVDGIITAAREAAASYRHYSPYRFMYRSFFTQMPLLGRLPGFASLFRGMAGGTPLTGRPARHQISPITLPQKKKPLMRVGYFLGCATNYLLPEVAVSVVNVLTHLGCEVVTPPFACCGLPLAAEGEAAAAKKTLEVNRRLYQAYKLDALITDCSSCSHHLTGQGLAGDAQPVYEFCEFLVKVLNPARPAIEISQSVACHYPCHLRHGRKSEDHLHQILGNIPGLSLMEIPGGGSCCGGGGSFSIKQKSISSRILQKYTGQILSSGAQCAATVCPSCIMQLRRGLKNQDMPVLHAAQLLSRSYLIGQSPIPEFNLSILMTI